jgi:hypothetical protein
MSVNVAANRFILPSTKRYAGFYQQLLAGAAGFLEFGGRLVKEIELARALRQADKVKELGVVLSNIPVKEYQLIGQYYLGWHTHRTGGDAQRVFEEVFDRSKTYRARALMSLAAVDAINGDLDAEMNCFTEGLKVAKDLPTQLDIYRGIAIVKAKEGCHQSAVKDLEAITPLLRHVSPDVYYNCLNSLAVELGEVGRVQEAKHISNLVLTCPFLDAYPEWCGTAEELAEKARSKSRSVVAMPSKQTVSEQPEAERVEFDFAPDKSSSETKPSREPASVLLFPRRNGHQPKTTRPAAITRSEYDRWTVSQKRAMLLAVAHDEDTPEDDFDKMLEAGGFVLKEEEFPKALDLETPGELEDIVTLWVNGEFGPERFAAIISALRDCEDNLRRKNLMDRMISYAFRESGAGIDSENEWRTRVEARLKSDPE